MADTNVSWTRSANIRCLDPNNKLFLFGYSCKIFRDDEKALYIDQGKHLIPWMGDGTLMIDRYDVRGYLHDLKEYEPEPGKNYEDPFSEEEKLCDEERYLSLRTDQTEEQLYQEVIYENEEELKRLRAAIAGDGAYHEIAFTYDNDGEKYVEPEVAKVEEPEDELYQVPPGLDVPKGMEVPYNMKIHAIIEKTALFISEQGGQMEIIIKMKQHANPQFAFMHLDNPLYPYYKHLVKEIKAGSYKPVQIKKVSQSEDEDDDGHYLHPSLMAGKAENVPKFTVPSINFRRSHDDSYSVLVRNLQQHVNEQVESSSAQNDSEQYEGSDNHSMAVNYSEESGYAAYDDNLNSSMYQLVPPPPDVQPIIHKMAEYVAKNGEDFETIVKSKNDKRFAFLHPWNEYYHYYIYKRNEVKHWLLQNAPPSAQNNVQPTIAENLVDYNYDEPNSCTADYVSAPEMEEEHQVMANPPKDEFDALYSHDSQDAACVNEPVVLETVKDDYSDSLDFLDSPTAAKPVEEEKKMKPAKIVKGPISFSLKIKDSDAPNSDKTKMSSLLLGDSEEDSSEETQKEKVDCSTKKKATEELRISRSSRHGSVEKEDKVNKPNNEFLEAKQAEERIRDKLLAAARERMAQQKKEKQIQMEQQKREEEKKRDKQIQLDQQRKEKQLQLERKRKAALFLKMLKKRSPDCSESDSQKLGIKRQEANLQNSTEISKFSSDFWALPEATGSTSPENGILFPVEKTFLGTNNSVVIPGIKTAWSSNSNSVDSAEEVATEGLCDKLSSDSETGLKNTISKNERRKKKKKRSHAKSHEHSRPDRTKPVRSSRHRHRSRSPSRSSKHEKSKKEKELPAAYAKVARSRSRSWSPRRYRPSPSHWNRRR